MPFLPQLLSVTHALLSSSSAASSTSQSGEIIETDQQFMLMYILCHYNHTVYEIKK